MWWFRARGVLGLFIHYSVHSLKFCCMLRVFVVLQVFRALFPVFNFYSNLYVLFDLFPTRLEGFI